MTEPSRGLDRVKVVAGDDGRLVVSDLPDDRPLASMLHALLSSDGLEARVLAEAVAARHTTSLDIAGVRYDRGRVVLFDVTGQERDVPATAFDHLMARLLRAIATLAQPPVADARAIADDLDARATP
jgi:hypothetical protein